MIAPLHEGALPTATRSLALGITALGLIAAIAGGSPSAWVLWRNDPSASALLTSLAIHVSAEHVVFNMLSLVAIGSLLERRVGAAGLLACVLWTAIGSAAGWLVFDSAEGLGGTSGVCYGLLGACLVLCRKQTLSVGVSWPLALALLGATVTESLRLEQVASLGTLLCFLLPRQAGALLLRGRLGLHWLCLPLVAQAAHLESGAAAAHWGGFVAGAALGGAHLLGGRVVSLVSAHSTPAPRRPELAS